MNAPLEMVHSMTRDNFDPGMLLVAIKDGAVPVDQIARLLEEGCHAFHRLNHRHQKLISRVGAALADATDL